VEGHQSPLRNLILQELSRENPEAENNTQIIDVVTRVDQRIFNLTSEHQEKVVPPKRSQIYSRIAIAASLLLCLSISFYFLLPKKQKQQQQQQTSTIKQLQAINPGGNKATLILANGSTIVLTDAKNGKLAEQDAIQIYKTSDGKIQYAGDKTINDQSAPVYNTMATPKGGKYTLMLADGTTVILDAASSIKFPVAFTGKERIVEITGQVYFEVIHNVNKPFKVKVRGQVIEDLGTHFNINAYDDDPLVKTTLLEGSLRISIANSPNPASRLGIKLRPNQQAITKGGQIKIIDSVNPEEIIAWKEGYFRFDNSDIETIMSQFSRWYNIEVVYEGPIEKHEFMGKITRSSSLDKVLKVLALGGIRYRLEGRKLTILP